MKILFSLLDRIVRLESSFVFSRVPFAAFGTACVLELIFEKYYYFVVRRTEGFTNN